MKNKVEEKETLKYLNEISELRDKIDRLTIENKMLKNFIKRINSIHALVDTIKKLD